MAMGNPTFVADVPGCFYENGGFSITMLDFRSVITKNNDAVSWLRVDSDDAS